MKPKVIGAMALAALAFSVLLWNMAICRDRSDEGEVYRLVSEQYGVIPITEDDHKQFASFVLRVDPKRNKETPEFLYSLGLLKRLPDLRGVNLDGLNITGRSLDALGHIPRLERLMVRGTTLTDDDIARYRAAHPGVDVWTTYDQDHP